MRASWLPGLCTRTQKLIWAQVSHTKQRKWQKLATHGVLGTALHGMIPLSLCPRWLLIWSTHQAPSDPYKCRPKLVLSFPFSVTKVSSSSVSSTSEPCGAGSHLPVLKQWTDFTNSLWSFFASEEASQVLTPPWRDLVSSVCRNRKRGRGKRGEDWRGSERVGWRENVWLTGVTFCLLLGCCLRNLEMPPRISLLFSPKGHLKPSSHSLGKGH